MAGGFLSGLARRAYDTGDSIRDTAEDYGRDARDYGRDVARRARDRGEDARGELSRLWSQLEDAIERNLGSSPREAVRTAGSYARDYAEEGRDYAYELADQLRSATRARPLVAIGIAVAATLVLTSLLSGGKRR